MPAIVKAMKPTRHEAAGRVSWVEVENGVIRWLKVKLETGGYAFAHGSWILSGVAKKGDRVIATLLPRNHRGLRITEVRVLGKRVHNRAKVSPAASTLNRSKFAPNPSK
jgi:hypothetical protein